jgi:UDP-N-acetylmuramate dehydrogenase
MNEKMMLTEVFYQKLKDILNENQILIDEPLKKHTTFEVGGPASFLILPDNISQIEESVKLCKKENMPFYVIGNGSNLLVSDKGYTGVIIKICKKFSDITITKESNSGEESQVLKYIVEAESGVLLSELSSKIADFELTGFEFAAGIPGTLGGAVTMNAGAYDGEIKDCIIGATVMDTEGNIYELNKEELQLGYRKSIIQDNHYIVLKALFIFEKGNQKDINDKIIDLNNRRATFRVSKCW